MIMCAYVKQSYMYGSTRMIQLVNSEKFVVTAKKQNKNKNEFAMEWRAAEIRIITFWPRIVRYVDNILKNV